jgi:SAM-dependent methyltransferase
MADLPPEMNAACAPSAEIFGVPERIHPDDFMFWAIHDWAGADKSSVVKSYFESGNADALFIKQILDRLPSLPRPLSFLEFASGYGRVSRHMSRLAPEVSLTACDIHPAAVAFLRSLNIPAVLSTRVPEEFNPGQTFDVIFALSFFSHIPRATWGRWLKSLSQYLKPDGVLIFTTCGRVTLTIPSITSLSIVSESVPADGFLFLPVSDQRDLELADYGTSLAFFEFVCPELLEQDLRIVWYQEAMWCGHQDLFVVKQGDANFRAYKAARHPAPRQWWRRFR